LKSRTLCRRLHKGSPILPKKRDTDCQLYPQQYRSAARAAGRLTKPEVLPNFELPTNVYTMFCLGQKYSDKKCVDAELLPAPSFLGGENQLVHRIAANHPNARESKVLQLLFQLKRIVLSIFAPRFRDLEGPPPEWRQLQEAARINI